MPIIHISVPPRMFLTVFIHAVSYETHIDKERYQNNRKERINPKVDITVDCLNPINKGLHLCEFCRSDTNQRQLRRERTKHRPKGERPRTDLHPDKSYVIQLQTSDHCIVTGKQIGRAHV